MVSAASIMEAGDYQLSAPKLWKNLYLSMPVYLYIAENDGYPSHLCFIGLVEITLLIKYKLWRKYSIENSGSRLCLAVERRDQKCRDVPFAAQKLVSLI